LILHEVDVHDNKCHNKTEEYKKGKKMLKNKSNGAIDFLINGFSVHNG